MMDKKPEPVAQPGEETMEERPPLFRSWNAWYALVLGTLAFLIVLFTLFTHAFS
jgi:hypothetical protein